LAQIAEKKFIKFRILKYARVIDDMI